MGTKRHTSEQPMDREERELRMILRQMKMECSVSKLMGCIKSVLKMEFYNSKCILQKKKKKRRNLRQPSFTPQGAKRKNKVSSKLPEGNEIIDESSNG